MSRCTPRSGSSTASSGSGGERPSWRRFRRIERAAFHLHLHLNRPPCSFFFFFCFCFCFFLSLVLNHDYDYHEVFLFGAPWQDFPSKTCEALMISTRQDGLQQLLILLGVFSGCLAVNSPTPNPPTSWVQIRVSPDLFRDPGAIFAFWGQKDAGPPVPTLWRRQLDTWRSKTGN